MSAALPVAFPSIPLPDGTLATLRPVAPADAEAERAFVAGLSARARYDRFHGAVNGLSDDLVRYLTCVDQDRHVALVAVVARDRRERVVADARYVVDGDAAEFAIAVADQVAGCGVARRLLAALAACARRSGVRWLVGEVLATNRAMLCLAERLGFAQSCARRRDGVVRIERSVAPIPEAFEGALARTLRRLCRRVLPARPHPRAMFVPY
jgi:acetyltransferase